MDGRATRGARGEMPQTPDRTRLPLETPMASARRCGRFPFRYRDARTAAVARVSTMSGVPLDPVERRRQIRMRSHEPRVGRTLLAACRDRPPPEILVRGEQQGNERRQHHQCCRADDHTIGAAAQPPGREREQDVQRHDEARRVGEHADAMELRVAGALEHHGHGQEPQGDEEHSESASQTPAPPVQTDRDRREDQVDLVDRGPARIVQRIRGHQDRE